jgi:hypothetical protein
MASGAFLVAAMVAVAVSAAGVGGDFAADQKECSDKLVSLATCLTFVQGQAPSPTPDCCAGLKTVLQTGRKCLCVLVKDRDDPGLGLKINVTRALGLPAACSAPANISDCPSTSSHPLLLKSLKKNYVLSPSLSTQYSFFILREQSVLSSVVVVSSRTLNHSSV